MDSRTNSEMSSQSQIELIEDLIINMVRLEPSLYDKGDASYHEQYKERWRKFEIISVAIFQAYKEHWTEQQISSKWDALVRKYRDEYKKVNSYRPSGSSADTVQSSDWPLYSQMNFLEAHIQHRPSISSTQTSSANSEPSQQQQQHQSSTPGLPQHQDQTPAATSSISGTSTPQLLSSIDKSRFKRTRKADQLDELKTLFHENSKACDQLFQLKNNECDVPAPATPSQNAGVKRYSLLLRAGFKKIPNKYKFDCCTDIIQYIQDFKDNL